MAEIVTGFDISGYQEHADISAAADDGQDFVFIKATEGLGTDDQFAKHWEQAKSTPCIQGAYGFLRWERANVVEQAKHFCQVVSLERGELAPAMDLEWLRVNDEYVRMPELTRFDRATLIANRARAWLETVEDHFNRLPYIYLPVAFWHDYLCADGAPVPAARYLTRYLLWAAGGRDSDFADQTPLDGANDWRWTFRQTSGHGRVKGVTDSHGHPVNVDTDVFYGSIAELRRLALIPD